MSKPQRMQYRGKSRDIQYSPWVRLVHGKHYNVSATQTCSGKVRCKITDEMGSTAKETYKDEFDFSREWG